MADDNDDDNSATLALVYSPAASAVHDRLPSNLGRSSLVHGLIDALGIIKNRPSAIILRPQPATADQLGVFHSARYLTILNAFAKEQDVPATYLHAAGLEDDCPTFKGLIPHVLLSVGGTLSAIQFALSTRDTPRIALHWDGGRHHAKSSAAGGFCYANDVAIGLHCAISMLSISDHLPGRRLMPRIVYLDLDVHHGDGVEDAVLEMSDGDVLAVSIHHASPGFYPGTGTDAIIDAFEWPGDETPTRAIDIPLARGASDTTVIAAVSMVLTGLQMHSNDSEQPRLVVVQAGADGLAGDPKAMGAWNCSTRAIVHSVALIRAVWPVTNLVVLGGGGYNHANTARVWAQVTALAGNLTKRPCALPYLLPPLAEINLSVGTPLSTAHLFEHLGIPLDLGLSDGVPTDWDGADAFGPSFEFDVPVARAAMDANVLAWDAIKKGFERNLARALADRLK